MSGLQLKRLSELVFLAVDKGSPLELRKDGRSLKEIADKKFGELKMTEVGISHMWQVFNAHADSVGSRDVDKAAAAQCKTVSDVWTAVFLANGYDKKQVPAIPSGDAP